MVCSCCIYVYFKFVMAVVIFWVSLCCMFSSVLVLVGSTGIVRKRIVYVDFTPSLELRIGDLEGILNNLFYKDSSSFWFNLVFLNLFNFSHAFSLSFQFKPISLLLFRTLKIIYFRLLLVQASFANAIYLLVETYYRYYKGAFIEITK